MARLAHSHWPKPSSDFPIIGRGGPPPPAPASPSATPHPPCPIAVTLSAYAQIRASPFFLVLQFSAMAVGRGGRGRVVSAIAYTPRIPRPPGRGASISRARCPRPRPPPGNRGSSRSGFPDRALERPPRGYPAGQGVYVWTCQSNCSMYCT